MVLALRDIDLRDAEDLEIFEGNTSNLRLREVLSVTLLEALRLLEAGEELVEISGK